MIIQNLSMPICHYCAAPSDWPAATAVWDCQLPNFSKTACSATEATEQVEGRIWRQKRESKHKAFCLKRTKQTHTAWLQSLLCNGNILAEPMLFGDLWHAEHSTVRAHKLRQHRCCIAFRNLTVKRPGSQEDAKTKTWKRFSQGCDAIINAIFSSSLRPQD